MLYKPSQKSGFTLAEILLAMMVFAIAITTILGLLARSIETADSILVKDEAISLSSAVDSYMAELSFRNAFYKFKNLGGEAVAFLYAYQYRAKQQSDGSLNPYKDINDTDQLGSTYLVVPGVRDPAEPELANEAEARESRLFLVKLSVSDANPLKINIIGRNPDSVDDATGYNSAVLVIFAEFYEVPAVASSVPDTSELSPVFSFNFAVRR